MCVYFRCEDARESCASTLNHRNVCGSRAREVQKTRCNRSDRVHTLIYARGQSAINSGCGVLPVYNT